MYEPSTPIGVIAAAARQLRTAPGKDLPRRIGDLAREIDSELGHAPALRRIADDLLPLAREMGCDSVVGASRVGERIAGALIAKHGDELGIQPGSRRENVLVIDGVLSTGMQMQRAISRERDAGAHHVAGIVLVGDREALRLCSEDTHARIVALEEV